MSMGFLVKESAAIVWRGPMVHSVGILWDGHYYHVTGDVGCAKITQES